MMMQHAGWRELFRTDDLTEAHLIVMSLLAMEFEARLADPFGGSIFLGESEPTPKPPYCITVRDEDWAELRDVLRDILDEQAAFDEEAADRHKARLAWAAALSASTLGGAAIVSMLARG